MYELEDSQIMVIFSTLVTCYIGIQWLKRRRMKSSRNRRFYTRNENLDRHIFGFYESAFKSIKNNEEEFFKFTRMNVPLYNMLLSFLESKLSKRHTIYTISAEARLAITLSYLSQGVSHSFLGWSFKVGKTTARTIILETCDIMWEVLAPLYVSKPTVDDYKLIASDFNNKWNLPNCVGAIDGKHISIWCPAHSGSNFYNYKNFYSIVLLATCDARYTFTMVDIGAYGSQSDGGILSASIFGKELFDNKLPLPSDSFLHNSEIKFPYFFVGDPAFPLKNNLMRGYSGKCLTLDKKIFNYRISRARVTIENAFGILVVRWRILQTSLNCQPKNAEKIVLVTVALHNFIKLNQSEIHQYCPPDYVDREDYLGNTIPGRWRQELDSTSGAFTSVGSNRAHNAARDAYSKRDILTKYFLNEGAIQLQNKIK